MSYKNLLLILNKDSLSLLFQKALLLVIASYCPLVIAAEQPFSLYLVQLDYLPGHPRLNSCLASVDTALKQAGATTETIVVSARSSQGSSPQPSQAGALYNWLTSLHRPIVLGGIDLLYAPKQALPPYGAIPVILSNLRPHKPLESYFTTSVQLAFRPLASGTLAFGPLASGTLPDRVAADELSDLFLKHYIQPGQAQQAANGGALDLEEPAVMRQVSRYLGDAQAQTLELISQQSTLKLRLTGHNSPETRNQEMRNQEIQTDRQRCAVAQLSITPDRDHSLSLTTLLPSEAVKIERLPAGYLASRNRLLLDTHLGFDWPIAQEGPNHWQPHISQKAQAGQDKLVVGYLSAKDLWLLAESQLRKAPEERLQISGLKAVVHPLREPWNRIVALRLATGASDNYVSVARTSQKLYDIALPLSLVERLAGLDGRTSRHIPATGLRDAHGKPLNLTSWRTMTIPPISQKSEQIFSAIARQVSAQEQGQMWTKASAWRLDLLIFAGNKFNLALGLSLLVVLLVAVQLIQANLVNRIDR